MQYDESGTLILKNSFIIPSPFKVDLQAEKNKLPKLLKFVQKISKKSGRAHGNPMVWGRGGPKGGPYGVPYGKYIYIYIYTYTAKNNTKDDDMI